MPLPKRLRSNQQSNHWFNRRNLLATFGLAASGSVVAAGKASPDLQQQNSIATSAAKQQIAELRVRYGIATDLIGTAEPKAVAEGRRIYRSIFREDAVIRAPGRDDAIGPDAWVDVVLDALKVYQSTQHLIGTQLVEVQNLPTQAKLAGRASMTSYLQAWHAKADGELWLFIGTYVDQLVYNADTGWQIAQMELQQVSGETRTLNS